jgi:hypothetical protein
MLSLRNIQRLSEAHASDMMNAPSQCRRIFMREIPDQVKKKLASVNTFDWHRAHPEISLSNYSRMLRRKAASSLGSRQRIYLDTKYWNYCRDVIVCRPQKPEHAEIWRLLSVLFERGLVVCPVCQPNFLETLKLESDSRLVVTDAMDRLSLGVAIQPPQELTKLEISYWTWTKLFGEESLGPIQTFAFMPAAFVLEELHIANTAFPPSAELMLQKAFLDVDAAMTLRDIALMTEHRPASGDNDAEFQKLQNFHAKRNRTVFETFEQVYAIELDGIADLHEETLQGFGQQLWERGRRAIFDEPAESPEVLTRNLTALLIAGLKLGRISTEIPSLHIDTSLHAAIRFKRQKFSKGDLWDFRHAVAALGYCDAFFTDRRLANLLKSKPPDLGRQYPCAILSDDQEIIDFLQEIGNQRC